MNKIQKSKNDNVYRISLLVILLIISGFNPACSSGRNTVRERNMNKIEQSPQYQDGKFYNMKEWKQPSFVDGLSTGWKFLFGGDQRTPDIELPRQQADLRYFNDSGSDQLNVTWLGHSSLMINIDGYKILTDPVLEKKITFFGPSRFNGEVPVDIEAIGEIDIILISHNHYDHLNEFTIKALHERTGLFITPLAVGPQLESWGVPPEKIVELDWWDEYRFDAHLMIALTPTQHFSGRGLFDRDETLWGSFIVSAPFHKIYFGSDSGYFTGFKQIGEKYGPFDMTFLECGAYNEQWYHIHMFPEETAQAHLDLKGDILHPIHWGTFNLSLHPWYEPMQRLAKAADSLNIRTATPVVGETSRYNSYIPSTHWWDDTLNVHLKQKPTGVEHE